MGDTQLPDDRPSRLTPRLELLRDGNDPDGGRRADIRARRIAKLQADLIAAHDALDDLERYHAHGLQAPVANQEFIRLMTHELRQIRRRILGRTEEMRNELNALQMNHVVGL